MGSSSLLTRAADGETDSLSDISDSWSNAKGTEELSVSAILFLFTVSMSSTLELLSLSERRLYRVGDEEVEIIDDTKACLCVDGTRSESWTGGAGGRKETLSLDSG